MIALLGLAGAVTCYAAIDALPAGAPVSQRDVEPVACAETPHRAPVRYDPLTRAVTMTEAADRHTYLGPLPILPKDVVRKGATLVLRTAVGSIIIERSVTALQPARDGDRVYVRDSDDHVFSAPLALSSGK